MRAAGVFAIGGGAKTGFEAISGTVGATAGATMGAITGATGAATTGLAASVTHTGAVLAACGADTVCVLTKSLGWVWVCSSAAPKARVLAPKTPISAHSNRGPPVVATAPGACRALWRVELLSVMVFFRLWRGQRLK